MNLFQPPQRSALALAALLILGGAAAHAAEPTPQVAAELAPSGTLRAAINYGNAVLAVRNQQTGVLEGVSVDLAQELGKRLHVPVKLVPYSAARSVVEGAGKKEWDVAFAGADPARAQDMVFTDPYLIIEGGYMVRQDSPIKTNADVDKDGVQIAISKGSAYDLFLTKEIRHARLVHTGDPADTTEMMMAKKLDVVAGVKQRNIADAQRIPGLRQLDGSFMQIRQAMATVKGRGTGSDTGAAYLHAFVEEMKSSGFIARSLKAHHVDGALVAGPAKQD